MWAGLQGDCSSGPRAWSEASPHQAPGPSSAHHIGQLWQQLWQQQLRPQVRLLGTQKESGGGTLHWPVFLPAQPVLGFRLTCHTAWDTCSAKSPDPSCSCGEKVRVSTPIFSGMLAKQTCGQSHVTQQKEHLARHLGLRPGSVLTNGASLESWPAHFFSFPGS